jgi:O-antigen/teichoic acid export membrane protein
MYRRIAKNSAVVASGTAASSILMMLSVALAARALPSREFGVLVLLQSSVLMLRAVCSFSTQQPVIKLGSDAQEARNNERLGAVVSMGILVDLVSSVIALALAAIFIELSRATIGLADKDVGSAWILAFSLLFTGYPTSAGIFRLYDRFGLAALIQTASAAGLLAAYFVLFMISAELQAFVWAWGTYFAISSIGQLLVGIELLRRRHVPLRLRMRPFWSHDGRVLLDYCWSTWGTSTTETIRTNGDSLLVGAIASVEAAGVYNVARQLAGVLRKFNVVYTSTVFPEIARLASRGDDAGARELSRRMLMTGVAFAAVAVLTVAVVGRPAILLLFGERFSSAYLPLILLTAAAAGQLISFTPSMYVQIYRGPRLLLVTYAIATVVFLLAAVPLTYAFSIAGMALAQLVFAIVLTFSCSILLRKRATRAGLQSSLDSLDELTVE